MNKKKNFSLYFTKIAARKFKKIIKKKNNLNLKLRIYITGGGCNGFKYNFSFDEKINKDDLTILKKGVVILVDPISFQYLIGSSIDYIEKLEGSKFVINNPNVDTTCSCGNSFSI